MPPTGDLFQSLKDAGNFTILLGLLADAGYPDGVDRGFFTVFAPNDDALADTDVRETLVDNPNWIIDLLIAGSESFAELEDLILTEGDAKYVLDRLAVPPTIGGAAWLKEIPASNGIIHELAAVPVPAP